MNKLTKDVIKDLVTETLQERKAVVSEGRISKRDLQRIIKEEYAGLAKEARDEEPTGDEPMRGNPFDVAPATVGLPKQSSNRKIAAEVEKLATNLVKKNYVLAGMVGNLQGVAQNDEDFKNTLKGILYNLTQFHGDKTPEQKALINYLQSVVTT